MLRLSAKGIEKKNPLKQGLKPDEIRLRPLGGCYIIEKKNPLKQGLKLSSAPHDRQR